MPDPSIDPLYETDKTGLIPPDKKSVSDPLVSGEATVSGQLDTLLKKDSPLYDIAEGDTAQRMNERGIANSSIALGEREAARTRVALDVAEQDASTFAASDLSAQQHTQAGELSAQEHGQAGELSGQGFEQDTALIGTEYDERGGLSEQEHGQDLSLSAQKSLETISEDRERFKNEAALLTQDWDAKFQFQTEDIKNDLAVIGATLDADLEKIARNGEVQKDIDAARYTEVLGGQFLNSVTERQIIFGSEVEAIYQTEGLTAAQQENAIKKATSRYQDALEVLGDYYAGSPTWDPDWDFEAEADTGAGAPDTGAPDDWNSWTPTDWN